MRKDIHSKRTSDSKSHEVATTIARYVFPDRGANGAAQVEAGAYFRATGVARCRGRRTSDHMAQGAGPGRQECQRSRCGRFELRQIIIFCIEGSALLPASPGPETII